MLETGPARTTAPPSAGKRAIPGPILAGGYIVAAIAPLGAALISGVEPGGLWLELGTALALVAAAVLLLQFLSSGRLEVLSGAIGIDRTMGFHRIAALTLLLLAVLHPLSYVAGTLVHEPAAGFSRLLDMLARPRLRSGVIALAILLAIVALAVVRHRKLLRYETWRASHGLMACAAAGFTLHHALAAGTYSAELPMRALWLAYGGAALAAILLTYIVRPWRMWRGGWTVESSREAAENVTELILKAPDDTDFSFRGGQFVWLTIAPHRPPFHDHPFSIASSAAQLPRLRLLVRHAGDCTDRFGVIAPGTPVAVDGPHGSFILPDAPSTIAMIAGGVGIAPCLGMLEEAAARGDRRAFRLVYAARCNAALAALERLRELQSRLDLTILTIVDEPSTEPAHLQGPLQPEHVARALDGADTGTLAALVCGPPRMMELVTDGLLARGVAPTSIHYERFDYAAGRGRLDRWRRNRALGVLAVIAAAILAFASR